MLLKIDSLLLSQEHKFFDLDKGRTISVSLPQLI